MKNIIYTIFFLALLSSYLNTYSQNSNQAKSGNSESTFTEYDT